MFYDFYLANDILCFIHL
jgi:hypothetical protein